MSVTIHPLEHVSDYEPYRDVYLNVLRTQIGLRKQGLMRHRADAGSNLKALCEEEKEVECGRTTDIPEPKDGNANIANISS